MKKILRSTMLVSGAAAALFIPGTNANADPSAAEFNGTAKVGCFGCGVYGPAGNSARFCVNGVVNGVVVNGGVYNDATGNSDCDGSNGGDGVTGHGNAVFTVNEPVGGASCVVSGTAEGDITVSGVSGSAHFNWTRTGAHAIITTDWGNGAAVFHVTSPVGNPCTFAVTADFQGSLAGEPLP